MNEIKTINISSEIFKKIEEKIRDPLVGFEKVEDYIKFVLEKALDIESDESKSTKTEDEKVEEKLRQLGYI
jgi:hypothetical protein